MDKKDKKNKKTEEPKLPAITEEVGGEKEEEEKEKGEDDKDLIQEEVDEFFAILRRIQMGKSVSVGRPTISGDGATTVVREGNSGLAWNPVFRSEDFGEETKPECSTVNKKETNTKKRLWIDLNELPSNSSGAGSSSSN